MFARENVMVTLKRISSAVQDNKEQTRKMMLVRCSLAPLDVELAQEIDSSLVYHLFAKDGDKFIPRSELPSSGWPFNFKIPRQNVIFRAADGIENTREVQAVDVKGLQTARGNDDPHITLSFSLLFEVPEPHMAAWLLLTVGDPVAITFDKMQPSLPITEARGQEDGDAATQ